MYGSMPARNSLLPSAASLQYMVDALVQQMLALWNYYEVI